MTETALAELLAAGSVRAGPGGVDDRRGALRRASCCVVALGDRHRRDQAPAGVGGGHPRRTPPWSPSLLVGLARAGPGHDPPDAGRARRRQGAVARRSVEVFDQPVIQRCQLHKIRNVQDHLPQRLRSIVGRRMRDAYHADSALEAEAALQALASELDKTHPGAAASLREGLDRDAHRAPPRSAAHPGPHAALHERDRVDDLDLPGPRRATSNAGATGRWRCAGAPPAWSKPASSSAASTATCTYPPCGPPSNGTSPQTVRPDMHDEHVNAA